MQSVDKIMELESAKPTAYVPEVVQQRSAPIFVTQPAPVQVYEGDWARFVCRVTGWPRPRVLWIVNGKTVVNVSIISAFHIPFFIAYLYAIALNRWLFFMLTFIRIGYSLQVNV